MEQDIKKEILKKIEKMGKGTILLHGGWGIGKTFLAKKYIYDQWKKRGKNVLYFDARGIETLPTFQETIFKIMFPFKNNTEKNFKIAKNMLFGAVNIFVKANIPYYKIEDKDKVPKVKTKDKSEINLIIDEVDRVSGESILKTLNLINILKVEYEEQIKIIVFGNKGEMNSVLEKSIGIKTNGDFLHKYFDNEIAISELEKKASLEILRNSDYSFLLDIFEGYQNKLSDLEINPRKLKRFLKGIKNIELNLSNELAQILFIYWLISEQVKKFDFEAKVFANVIHWRELNSGKLFYQIPNYDDLNFKISDFNIDALFRKHSSSGIDIFKKLFSKEYGLENFDAWYEWIQKVE